MPAEPPPAGADGAPLLILGGHRCGTSLVSGLLWQAGLHLGTLLPAGPDNPRGFFESVDVLRAHEALLQAQERDWTCPPHRLDVNAVDLGGLEEVVAGLAGAGRPWGVKDPRLLFLLPAWALVLPAMSIIGVLRHPSAAAASLVQRKQVEAFLKARQAALFQVEKGAFDAQDALVRFLADHADRHLRRRAGLLEAAQELLEARGVVGEGLLLDQHALVGVDDAGDVLVLGDVNAAES